MPVVSGLLKLVTDRPALVSEVWVRSSEVRPVSGGLVTDFNDTVPVQNGSVSFECVPGPAVLVLVQAGVPQVPIPILVGDAPSSQTLAEVVQNARVAGGRTADELQALVRQIQDAIGDSADQVRDASRSAESARVSAAAAAGSESRAKKHADTAEDHADTAGSHAESAGKSASDAGTYATSAKNYAVTSIGQADKATGAADRAGVSAASAKADADRVATIAGSTRWVGTKVEVNGKLSPDLKGEKGDKGNPGRDGSTRFEDLTPAQRESLVGKQGPAGVVASATDPGKDVVWLDTAGQVGGLSEPYELVASGTGWRYATKPGGSSRYVVDYRGWAVLTVTATNCDEVRLYDFSQATNPFAFAVPPAGNIKGAFLTTQAVINCAPNGPAVRVLNPTPETKIWLSVEPLEARGQVVWVPDGKGGREQFTALSGPPGRQGPPGPPGTTAWSGITGKPATYPTVWGDVVGKPATFPAAAHRHTWGEIDGKPASFPAEKHRHQWSEIDGKPSSFPPESHRHEWSEIDGKPDLAAASHKHDQADITGTSNDIGEGKAGKLVRSRDADGKIFTYTPVSEVTIDKELVAKNYVDAQVKTVADQVAKRPALFSGAGKPPATIPGAVPGDYWLDTSSMELYEIKTV